MADDRNLVEVTVRLKDETTNALRELDKRINDILKSPSGAGFATTNQADKALQGLLGTYNNLKPAVDAFNRALVQGSATASTSKAAVVALTDTKRQLRDEVVKTAEAHDRGSRSVLEYAQGYIVGRFAVDAFYATLKLIPNQIQEGIRVIDKMRMSAASMAGAMLTNNPALSFAEGLGRANAIVEKTFDLSGKFVGNARELQILAEAMTTFGYKINLTTQEGQNQFVTFGNILKLVTQGQNFEIQAFQELRALMMGQNFQGAMLARRLEAMGVNVKAMIPLWVEQGTVVENVVKILGGYEKASTSIYMTMEAQKRTLESMVQKTLAIGLKEVYADLVSFLKDINATLIGEDGKGGAARSMGESIRDTYRSLKEDMSDIPGIIKNLVGAIKFYRDFLSSSGKGSSSPISDSFNWLTFKLSRFAGYKGTESEFRDETSGRGLLRELEYNSNLGSQEYPAETISGRPKQLTEAELKQRKKTLDEIEKFEQDALVRRAKLDDEFEGRKLELILGAGRKALKIEDMIDEALENRAITKARRNELIAENQMAYQEDFNAIVEKMEAERSEKRSKTLEKEIELNARLAESGRKLSDSISEGFRAFSERYAPENAGASSYLEKELQAIDRWAAKEGEKIAEVHGEWSDLTFVLADVVKKMKELAGIKAIEKSKISSEAANEKIAEWRREAETPVKWPWNEKQVTIMEAVTKAQEDLTAKTKAWRKEGLVEGYSQEKIDAGTAALYDRYQKAVKQVMDANDITLKVTADVWRGWFDSMNNAFSSFFEDALTGKLKSFKDYFQSFVNSLARIWAKGMADMITDKLKFGAMGEGAGVGFGQILSFLGGMIGLGGGTQATGAGYGENASWVSDTLGMGSMYADGGIINGQFVPIRAFASGGIASRPTLGLIGEGAGPEAVIPLKGGAVPVSLSGSQGPRDVNVNFNIVAADTKDFDRLLSERRSLIAGIVRSELANASYMRDSIRRYA